MGFRDRETSLRFLASVLAVLIAAVFSAPTAASPLGKEVLSDQLEAALKVTIGSTVH